MINSQLLPVALTDKYTVVGSYEPDKRNSLAYESEAQLEKRFIALLSEQGYEYLKIHTEEDLVANLRRRLEALNHIAFTEGEWKRFFAENIANEREFALEKTRKIQEDYIQAFIAGVNADADVAEAWMAFVEERKKRDLTELIEKERLKAEETVKFFESALKAGMLKTTGTEVDLILPAMSRFGNVRKETKERVISALQNLFERYKGL